MVRRSLKKRIASVLIVLGVLAMGMQNIYATESYRWSSSKIPGMTTTSKTTRKMYYYTGDISFKATNLTTDSSYVAGKCVGKNIDINNANKCVLVSRLNVPVTFRVKPTTDGRTYMSFEMYVEHNATTYQNVYGEGTISD